MNGESSEAEARRSQLATDLGREARKHTSIARVYNMLDNTLFYASLMFGGLAVVGGIIKSRNIPSENISIITAISTGLIFLSREAKYRLRAEWHYAVREAANSLIAKLNYEMPIPVTRESVAAISEEWRQRRAELGGRMTNIHGSLGPAANQVAPAVKDSR